MTRQEAREIIESYRELEDDTNEYVEYDVRGFGYKTEGAFVFYCTLRGVEPRDEYDLVPIAVYENGEIFVLPT